MTKTKYVVGYRPIGHGRQPVGILFPEAINHKDLAVGVFGDVKYVLGGGFCYIEECEGHATTATVYGDSVSLKIKSRPEDAYYLNYALGLTDEIPFEIKQKDMQEIEVRRRASSTA